MKVKPELISSFKELPSGKKLYFASDFHLGAPTRESSLTRERKIIRWLEDISKDASAIFLVGDLFDFWFEYKTTVPKGSIRFQSKIAELVERGISIIFFTGNHDLWMFDYFQEELGVSVQKNPVVLEVNSKRIFVAHGDGLGSGDHTYKFIKRVFTNKLAQFFFRWLHPDLGVKLARYSSNRSRQADLKSEDLSLGEDEILFRFSQELEAESHHDYYLFGHRHLPMEMHISDNSTYINLGEWINYSSYVAFDGQKASLHTFNP